MSAEEEKKSVTDEKTDSGEENEEDEKGYEVEKILETRVKNGKREFKVSFFSRKH